MRLSNLDERTVSVIESILEHFVADDQNHDVYVDHFVWQTIRSKHTGVKLSEMHAFFKRMDELLDIGSSNSTDKQFTVDRMALDHFMSTGGIRSAIESELLIDQQFSERSSLELTALKSQVRNLELQNESLILEKGKLRTERNRWIIATVISLAGLALNIVSTSTSLFRKEQTHKPQLENKTRDQPITDSLETVPNQQTQKIDTLGK